MKALILNYTLKYNPDMYWVGQAGYGPSNIHTRGDKYSYTDKTMRFMVYTIVQPASIIKKNPIKVNLKNLVQEAKEEIDV